MKAEVLCKDCWTVQQIADLRVRCEPCDEKREFKSDEYLHKKAYMTRTGEYVCKTHRYFLLATSCNFCKRPVSLRARMANSGVVAILGDSGSGKSTFLYVLRRELGGGSNARVQIRHALGDSDAQLRIAVQETNRMRKPTPEGDAEQRRNYAWELVNTSSAERRWLVAFHDASGEMWINLETLPFSRYPTFYRYLGLITAAILVIDGERIPNEDAQGTYSDSVQEAILNELAITSALRSQMGVRNEPIVGAVVLSKADLLWDRVGCHVFRQGSNASPQIIRQEVRRLLDKSGRKFLLQDLDAMKLHDYFAVSALGEGGASVDIDDAKPERLAEPILSVIGVDAR